MDAIPFFRYGSILFLAGLLMYVFNNVVAMVLPHASQPSGSVEYVVIFMVWHGLLAIVVVKESAHFLMAMQKRRTL